MRVHLDRERCQGHGLCVMTAPDVFEMDETGSKSVVTIGNGAEIQDPDLVREAERAEVTCPEEAIVVRER